MAESSSDVILINSSSEETIDEKTKVLECPICLQTCIHPAIVGPCGHVFCFLCLKGVAYKNRKCALCRREIPTEFLDHPQLVNGIDDLKKTLNNSDEGFQWFYEGRNGWWQYDERTSQEIEESYQRHEKLCGILVAGYVYTVDFEDMVQLRKNDPSRQRRVKRDLSINQKSTIKGVAGLRIYENCITTTSNDVASSTSDNFISIADTDAAIIIASNIIDSTLAHIDDEAETITSTSEVEVSDQIVASIGNCNNIHNSIQHLRNIEEDDNRLENINSILDGILRLSVNTDSNEDEEDENDLHTIL